VFGCGAFINRQGELRTLPCQLSDADSRFSGLDGFYAAKLVKG
jgi:16S rRNA (cytosine967-C5)-methyltransferase